MPMSLFRQNVIMYPSSSPSEMAIYGENCMLSAFIFKQYYRFCKDTNIIIIFVGINENHYWSKK